MSSTGPPAAAPVLAARAIFERVLARFDGTKLSFDACRQTARFAAPETALEAATVTLFPPATAPALGVRELANSIGPSSSGTDLLVGSRGLHGPRVVGSVSERVPYQASCAELIVR